MVRQNNYNNDDDMIFLYHNLPWQCRLLSRCLVHFDMPPLILVCCIRLNSSLWPTIKGKYKCKTIVFWYNNLLVRHQLRVSS